MKKVETEHKMTVDFILYPGIKSDLENRIKFLLEDNSNLSLKDPVRAIMVPHAGWSHCDTIMAPAYASAAHTKFERIVILSRVHREPAKSIFLPEFLFYNTPLGKLDVDQTILEELLKSNNIFEYNNVPHVEEHSIEVQLPFIKYFWPEAKIVPILTGKSTSSISRKLSESLEHVLRDKLESTLFIVSSSISSYETGDKSRNEAERFISILKNNEKWNSLPEMLNKGDIGACSADCLSAILGIYGKNCSADILNLKYWENLEEKQKRVCFGAISIT